MDFIFIFVVYH